MAGSKILALICVATVIISRLLRSGTLTQGLQETLTGACR